MTEIRMDNYLWHIGCKEEKNSAFINQWQSLLGGFPPYGISHPAQREQRASDLRPQYATLLNRGSMRQDDLQKQNTLVIKTGGKYS